MAKSKERNAEDGKVFVWVCRSDLPALAAFVDETRSTRLPPGIEQRLRTPLRTKSHRHPRGPGAPKQEARSVNVTELWPLLAGSREERRVAVREVAHKAATKFGEADQHLSGGPLGAATVPTSSIDKSRLSPADGVTTIRGGLPSLGKRR
jgi:hypothetical protein